MLEEIFDSHDCGIFKVRKRMCLLLALMKLGKYASCLPSVWLGGRPEAADF